MPNNCDKFWQVTKTCYLYHRFIHSTPTYRHMNRKGKLYFRYGTMGSAKTALLLTTAYNFEERGMQYACFKPIIDTRDKNNVIRSRIGIERQCSWIYHDTDLYATAQEMFEDTMKIIDWFLIDEAQFLTTEQVDQLARVVDRLRQQRDMLRPAHRLPVPPVRGIETPI